MPAGHHLMQYPMSHMSMACMLYKNQFACQWPKSNPKHFAIYRLHRLAAGPG